MLFNLSASYAADHCLLERNESLLHLRLLSVLSDLDLGDETGLPRFPELQQLLLPVHTSLSVCHRLVIFTH